MSHICEAGEVAWMDPEAKCYEPAYKRINFQHDDGTWRAYWLCDECYFALRVMADIGEFEHEVQL